MLQRFCVLMLLCVPVLASASEDKPNIMLILADDQAFSTIAAAGNSEIKTPNIDRLYAKGTRFSHTYNMGGWNGAICIASRTMLNTGRSLWHAEAEEKNLKKQWVPEKQMWSQRMASAGYQTFFTGKWHVKADNEQIFEVSRHVRGGMPKQVEAGYDRPKSRDDRNWLPWDKSHGGFWEGGKHWSEVVGDDAVDYLNLSKQDERPFFMYLAFNAPHDPRQSPKSFVDMYPVDDIIVPKSFLAEYPYNIGSNKVRDEQLAPFPRTHYAVQVNRQEYYAIITHMDQQIGRILDQLEASGQADNTWIFFTADHGLGCGNHGLLGKQNQFDHSIRVPFVVTGPEVPHRTIQQRIYYQDLMPTCLELAGTPIPESVEFNSLLHLIQADDSDLPQEPSGEIYSGYTKTQRSFIDGQHKLILYPKIGVSLLYNLENDPEELTELSPNDGSFTIKKKLFHKLLQWQKKTSDTLDVKAAFPELAAQ